MTAKAWDKRVLSSVALVLILWVSACTPSSEPDSGGNAGQQTQTEEQIEQSADLPELSPLALATGERLHVVATTNILGDVVQNVGGDAIALTTLLPVGADPHSYSTTPEDLRTLSDAHVIFVVGEGVEESLLSVLENREGDSALVAVNTGIELTELAEAESVEGEEHTAEDEHHHSVDPHTWTAVPNVIHWVAVIEQTLSALDPAHAETYAANASAYREQLAALEAEIQSAVAAIPAEERKLVTDHETFGYFAEHYGFAVIGSVIPSFSTMAAPSAQELAALQEQINGEGVQAIFVGSTVNPDLAQQIAGDVGVQVVPLYADSLSAADGPAATYLDLMRYNVQTIVDALK
jgi:manganese/iron transport system substrate-binding protein